MSRSRGEPPRGLIDQDYPYQVAVLACEVSWRHENVTFLSDLLGCYRLTRSLWIEGEGFVIYCFSNERAAECFLKAFDGEWITALQHKKGTWRSKTTRMLVGLYG